MLLTESKLEARIREIGTYRYRDAAPIAAFDCMEDGVKSINGLPPADGEWGTIAVGERWAGRDKYLWLRTRAAVSREWVGRTVLGRFDFGNTGAGNNSGFESLLYVDGEIYQGVDANHQEVFLPEGAAGGEIELLLRLWSGLEGGGVPTEQEHKLALAELCWLDDLADDLYYLSVAALETVRQLHEHQPERSLLLTALDQAYRRIDWTYPGSGRFYDSVYKAQTFLRERIESMDKSSLVTVTAIGHTHIDVAWLWRLKHTREKCARSFSTVLRLMERYPDYVFLQTQPQPQLYEYVKSDFPELYAQIRERVREGRWEAGGGMWLEADCNLTSGESLVRQLLVGTRFLRDEFGIACTYLWLPDVFGYSWALPQILKKAGIDTFMTTKISWNQYNRMPHDTFRWRGIDGTEVLTHFITTPEPWSEPGSWFYTYNGRLSAKTVKGIWDAYRDKENNRELLLSYGYGDGGGGVNRDMLEMRRRLDLMPGLPKVKTGTATEYFAGLQERFASAEEYVHTWDGELYLESHRGTYTSQAYNKRMNRKLELLYRDAEWLGALAGAGLSDWSAYGRAELAAGWRIILRNQFHDIIPGSSIREVYEDSRTEYAEAEGLAAQALQAVRDRALKSSEGGFTVLNNANWLRADTVEITMGGIEAGIGKASGSAEIQAGIGKESSSAGFQAGIGKASGSAWTQADIGGESAGRWFDADGNLLLAQRTADGWLVETPQLAPMSLTTVRFVADEARTAASAGGRSTAPTAEGIGSSEPTNGNGPKAGWNGEMPGSVNADGIATPFAVSAGGIVTPFYEIAWDAESGQLTRIYDRESGREVLAPGCRGNVLQIFEDKPLAHEAWDIDIFYQEKPDEIRGLTEARVVENGPLRAAIAFEWRYGQSVIRQRMVVHARSRRIDFRTEADWQERQQLLKTAFAVDVRATEATYDIQFGNVKRPTHWNTSWDYARFETVGHQWADLSERDYGVSLLNDCKYGYDIKDNVMRLSLIKCATHPDPQADQGHHEFVYSLLPHRGDWLAGDTVREAWSLNNPVVAWSGESPLAGRSLLRTSSPNVIVDAVKLAEDEDRLVVRLHEFAGGRGNCTIESDFGAVSWQVCDLLERPTGELLEGASITLSMAPYEIKTLFVDLAEDGTKIGSAKKGTAKKGGAAE